MRPQREVATLLDTRLCVNILRACTEDRNCSNRTMRYTIDQSTKIPAIASIRSPLCRRDGSSSSPPTASVASTITERVARPQPESGHLSNRPIELARARSSTSASRDLPRKPGDDRQAAAPGEQWQRALDVFASDAAHDAAPDRPRSPPQRKRRPPHRAPAASAAAGASSRSLSLSSLSRRIWSIFSCSGSLSGGSGTA